MNIQSLKEHYFLTHQDIYLWIYSITTYLQLVRADQFIVSIINVTNDLPNL